MNNQEVEIRLNAIFKSASKELNGAAKVIVDKGYVFSEVDFKAEMVICGMNPSDRNDFLTSDNSYNFQKVLHDRYFKKFKRFTDNYENQHSFTYLDLFYQRHSKQIEINLFNSFNGKNFLLNQLKLTEEILSAISPKAILVFNKEAFSFFTKHPKLKVGLNWKIGLQKGANIWKTNNPNGNQVLLFQSRFLSHFVSELKIERIERDVNLLFDFLK